MKKFLCFALMMSCLYSCSQQMELAGNYVKKSGSIQYILQLSPSGVFHFDSYMQGLKGGPGFKGDLPAEPSISGRGTWSAIDDVIYFETNPDTDIDYQYTLNFNDTKAKFKSESAKDKSDDNSNVTLEFVDSGIFWLIGTELQKRD